MKDAQYWIERLEMEAHPEGGYFVETYRATEDIAGAALPQRFTGKRSFATSIYFLLTGEKFSAFHRIQSDEGWHYYAGTSSLTVYALSEGGTLHTHKLGPNWEEGQRFQTHIPAGQWFASAVDDPTGYALVGCTVAPGFDFRDFELAKRAELVSQFPAHKQLIEQLTRVRA